MAKVFNPESIRIIREAHNLSMDQLAGKLCVKTSRQLVYLWETGKHTPSADSLTLIVNALGLKSMDIFFTDIDQQYISHSKEAACVVE